MRTVARPGFLCDNGWQHALNSQLPSVYAARTLSSSEEFVKMCGNVLRCFAVRWVVRCAFVVGGLAHSSNDAYAQQGVKEPAPDKTSAGGAMQWEEVPAPSRAVVLGMIADQTQGNYESIRTWTGTYRVQLRQHMSPEAIEPLAGARGASSALWQEFDFTMCFAIDIASGSAYRSKKTKQMRWVKNGSGEAVTIPNTAPVDGRSLVTAEHYVTFDPRVVWPGFVTVRNRPEAQNRRAAFRYAREKSDRHDMGDLMDPRKFFCLSPTRRFDEELRIPMRMLMGAKGGDAQKQIDRTLKLYACAGPSGVSYRLIQAFEAPAQGSHGPALYMRAVFAADAGMNATSYSLALDKAGERPARTVEWQWKSVAGVHVPAKVKESHYSEQSGKLTYYRDVELQDCAINEPLDPFQFTYRGLGLNDGELVMDNINRACYVIRNGEPELLAHYDETPIPKSPGVWAHIPRLGLSVVGVLGAVLLFLVCWRVAKKGGGAGSKS